MGDQRHSRQREEIYDAVRRSQDHPTAEMVYHWLKPRMPRLSLGTVYRNLRQLAQEGLVAEVDGPVARFDGNPRPHTHFRCVCCGGVQDMEVAYDAGLDREAESQGYTVTGHILTFAGICSDCASHNRAAGT